MSEPADRSGRDARERRLRAARLLGDLMPSATSDDPPDAAEEGTRTRTREAELRRDVPPHHGG